MRKLYPYFILVLFNGNLFGQDLHFSQTLQVPLLINPAYTGVMDGWERISVHHRNQSLGSNGKYLSSLASIDFNLFKPKKHNKAYLGLGIFCYDDKSGDGLLGKQQISTALSAIVPISSSGHLISAGLQGGYSSSNLNSSGLHFENQWNGTVFDEHLSSGESFNNQFNYLDVGAGVIYQYDGSSKGFFGKSVSKFQFGGSVYHANRPIVQYVSGGEQTLERKFILHSAFYKDLFNTNLQLELDAAHFIQGSQRSTLAGAMLKYCFSKSGIWFGPSSSYFGAGLAIRDQSSFIPSVMILHRGFRVGLSYDYTFSKLRNSRSGGAFEVMLSWTNFQNAQFTRRRKHKKTEEMKNL